MNNKYIKLLVLLGALSIAGVVVVQIFWLRKAFDLREKQFTYNVNLALDNVVRALCEYNQMDIPSENPIEQVSGNYYVVRTNNLIPPGTLESLLKTEFQKRLIKSVYEFTIYDCSNQKVVYKDFVNINALQPESKPPKKKPLFLENEYYFGVFFPQKTAGIVNQMGVWIFSSSVLLIVIIFFAFALMIIFRQKRISEIQRDFVNNMAHEFNTPIASIGLAANYFRQQSGMATVKKSDAYLTIIEKENSKLKKQVEEILQLGKYEQSAFALKLLPCNLSDHIEGAKNEINHNFPDSDLRFQFSPEDDLIVLADSYHLKGVFYNLFENVIKYCSNQTKVDIAIKVSRNTISVLISDYGPGIPKKYHKKIFNRFFRVPGGDVQQVKGFGIGLFYVQFIIRKMRGNIYLKNSDNNGTVFQLKFKKTK